MKFEITQEQANVVLNVLGEVAAKIAIPAIDVMRSLSPIIDKSLEKENKDMCDETQKS